MFKKLLVALSGLVLAAGIGLCSDPPSPQSPYWSVPISTVTHTAKAKLTGTFQVYNSTSDLNPEFYITGSSITMLGTINNINITDLASSSTFVFSDYVSKTSTDTQTMAGTLQLPDLISTSSITSPLGIFTSTLSLTTLYPLVTFDRTAYLGGDYSYVGVLNDQLILESLEDIPIAFLNNSVELGRFNSDGTMCIGAVSGPGLLNVNGDIYSTETVYSSTVTTTFGNITEVNATVINTVNESVSSSLTSPLVYLDTLSPNLTNYINIPTSVFINSLGTPAATLDVNGAVKSNVGFICPDGTIVTSTAPFTDISSWTLPLYYTGTVASLNYNSTNLHVNGSNQLDTIQNINITGMPTFAQVMITSAPIVGSNAATKDYVDSAVQSIIWKDPILSFWDASSVLPVGSSTTDRYVCSVAGNGWLLNDVYQWNGATWTQYIPATGWAVLDLSDGGEYTFNGSAWVKFGSVSTHNNLSGLQGGNGSNEYYHLSYQQYLSALSVGSSTGSLQNQINNIAISTGVQAQQISKLIISTGAIQASLNNVIISTGVIQASLTNVIVSTGAIQASLSAVIISTGALQNQLNSIYSTSGTWTAIQTFNTIAVSTISLSSVGNALTFYSANTSSYNFSTSGINAVQPDGSNWGNASTIYIDTTTTPGSFLLSKTNNIAIYSTATASDYAPDYPPLAAVDIYDDAYYSTGTLVSHWWRTDLGSAVSQSTVTISEVAAWVMAGGSPCSQSAILQGSVNGSSWVTISTIIAYGNVSPLYVQHYSTPVAASYRYFRVYDTYQNPGGTTVSNFRVQGFKVYTGTTKYIQGTLFTTALDFGSRPSAWGDIVITSTIPTGASMFCYTQSSADGYTWSVATAAVNNSTILSPLNRYLSVQVVLHANSSFTTTPTVSSIVARAIGLVTFNLNSINFMQVADSGGSISVNIPVPLSVTLSDMILPAGAATGYFLQSDSGGNASWADLSGTTNTWTAPQTFNGAVTFSGGFNGSMMQKIYETSNVSVNSGGSITVNGLDGNSDIEYYIVMVATAAAPTYVVLHINNDSTHYYSMGSILTYPSGGGTLTTSSMIGYLGGLSGNLVNVSLEAESGLERCMTFKGSGDSTAIDTFFSYWGGTVWQNSSDNITSMNFSLSPAKALYIKRLIIYARR